MEYTTESFEPWDYIAKKIYGSEKYVHALMEENPGYLKLSILPPGSVVKIPKLKTSQPRELPPWRR